MRTLEVGMMAYCTTELRHLGMVRGLLNDGNIMVEHLHGQMTVYAPAQVCSAEESDRRRTQQKRLSS